MNIASFAQLAEKFFSNYHTLYDTETNVKANKIITNNSSCLNSLSDRKHSNKHFNKHAMLAWDKSDSSRRTCPLIAFRYVHRGGLNATPPVPVSDTTAVFAACEISTPPERGSNLSVHTHDMSYLYTYTLALDKFI